MAADHQLRIMEKTLNPPRLATRRCVACGRLAYDEDTGQTFHLHRVNRHCDEDIRDKWTSFINVNRGLLRSNELSVTGWDRESAWVCSRHFEAGCYLYGSVPGIQQSARLSEGAVPTLLVPPVSPPKRGRPQGAKTLKKRRTHVSNKWGNILTCVE